MSQFLCSSFNSKNYLINSSNKELNSNSIFWPKRSLLTNSYSSELMSSSYPPKANLCAKLLNGISAKIANLNHSCKSNSFNNQFNPFDELLSTQVLRKMSANINNNLHLDCSSLDMIYSQSDCMSPSSSCAERTAFSDDERLLPVNNCDYNIDSDSSNEKSGKIQICDTFAVQSMQNDRQKRKKRKRRRRKRKNATKTPTLKPCSPSPCFSMMSFNGCRNDFISIIIDSESSYDSNEDISSDEDLSCFVDMIAPDLEMMCKNLFVDCFFSQNNKSKLNNNTQDNHNSGIDEVDCCPNISNQIKSSTLESLELIEEEKEMTAIRESIKKANEMWSSTYSNVSSDDRISAKVNFTNNKPSVRTLHVWDFASRQARCGQWEQLARDRQRFAEKCRKINSDIGYIFSEEHRQRILRERTFYSA